MGFSNFYSCFLAIPQTPGFPSLKFLGSIRGSKYEMYSGASPRPGGPLRGDELKTVFYRS